MYTSIPFLKSAVKSTPVLVFKNSCRLETMEVDNPNTAQEFVQIFDVAAVADIKFAAISNVDTAGDILTSNAHGLVNNRRVRIYSTANIPTGLSADTDYFVVAPTTNTFQLAVAPGGAAIDISGAGSGTITVIAGLVQSFIIPAGDGTNSGAFSKEWPRGMILKDGLAVAVSTGQFTQADPTSNTVVQGSIC